MGILSYLSYLAAAALILFLLLTHLSQTSKAHSLHCKPAPAFRPWDILGIQSLLMELRGMKSNRLSHAFKIRKDEMSTKLGRDCKTFRLFYPPWDTWYYTFEPRNLQAVLATQFSDFQQPRARVGAFERLLGEGIVSYYFSISVSCCIVLCRV